MVCSKYAVDVSEGGGSGMEGYYVRMIPGGCKANNLRNWRPTYRIVSDPAILYNRFICMFLLSPKISSSEN